MAHRVRERPDNYLLSLVVPLYNEAASLPHLYDELARVLGAVGCRWELVLVDDHSGDGSPAWLEALAARDERVTVLRLARNCGHQIALCCGLDHARGDVVATLDGDLQHPPELLPTMLAQWLGGADVVHMVKARTAGRGALKNALATVFYAAFNALSDVRVPANGSDFRLLDRRCVDALKAMPERGVFLRAMVHSIGFRQVSLPYVAPQRFAGTPSFTLGKLWQLAASGFFSFSSRALLLPAVGGAALLALSLVPLVCALAGVPWLLRDTWVLLCALLALTGMVGCCLGLLGAFLYRVLLETKRRPLYLVEEAFGLKKDTPSRTWGGGATTPRERDAAAREEGREGL